MVKVFFTAVVTLLGLSLYSQIDCNIFILHPDSTITYNDTTLCYNTRLRLYTQLDLTLSYSWEPTGETGNTINVILKDTTTYILNVYNHDSTFHCTDTVTISIYPKIIRVEFEQLTRGCPGECKAQVLATASDGYPPYHYIWNAVVEPNDSTLALGLCSDQSYQIRVKDTICAFDTAFLVKPYDMPEVEVTVDPDTLFETNPQATFSFENKSADSIPLTNWVWVFPDSTTTNLLNPRYVFLEADSVMFIYTTIDGCVDTIYTPVSVQEFKLKIPNVFTPNGDGTNDKYEIPYLDRYITSQLVVYNRWGQKVFEGSNYSGSWDGGTLPDGVYFYILRCEGYWKEDIFRGSVSIYGSKY